MDHKVQYLHRKYRVHCSAICASLKYLSEVMGFFSSWGHLLLKLQTIIML